MEGAPRGKKLLLRRCRLRDGPRGQQLGGHPATTARTASPRPPTACNRHYPCRVEKVVVTDEGVSRHVPRLLRRDLNEVIAWRDLHRVEVVSSFSIAAKDDVYFLLVDGKDHGVAVGLSDALATGLIDRLQRLPGFDNQVATEAAGAAMRAVLWLRKD